MTGIEIALWPLAAFLLFVGLRALITRYRSARPWVFAAVALYLVGYFTWALMTPGNWRGEVVLAIFLAYAIWVGEVVTRASGRHTDRSSCKTGDGAG